MGCSCVVLCEVDCLVVLLVLIQKFRKEMSYRPIKPNIPNKPNKLFPSSNLLIPLH